MVKKPLCIDLFCGLGGWAEGFLLEGWDVVGFDITRHAYGDLKYPAQLVLQDILTMSPEQLATADAIVASPPCQAYSWLAMPWSMSADPGASKACKALRAKWQKHGPDNRLFDKCFELQREAVKLRGGKPLPLVVENVRGAQEWVGFGKVKRKDWQTTFDMDSVGRAIRNKLGKSTAHYGSFHLWGDVPDLSRLTGEKAKVEGQKYKEEYAFTRGPSKNNGGSWFPKASAGSAPRECHDPRRALKVEGGYALPDGSLLTPGGGIKRPGLHGDKGDIMPDGTKVGGDWFRDPACHSKHGSRSLARQIGAAMVAKIPPELSRHVARELGKAI